MLSLESFNTQLIVIMNYFAMAVLIHIKSSAAVQSNMKEEQGELDHAVKLKCIVASNTIMKLIRDLLATAHQDPLNPLQHHHTEGLNHSSGLVDEEEEEEGAEVEVESDPAACSPPPSQSELSLSASLALSVELDHRYIRSTSAVTPSSSVTTQASRRRRRNAAAMTTMVTRRSTKSDDEAESAAAIQDQQPSTPVTPYVFCHECPLCSALFSSLFDVHHHLRSVHSSVSKPYACDYCPKTFRHKSRRDLHHRCHRGEGSFQCEVCGKTYITASQLKVHKHTHGDKPFVCDVCGNAFYQFGHLNRHKLIHAAVRPFHCDVCGKGFTQAEGLKAHQLTHAGGQELCPVCGKIYRKLKYHMMKKHPEEERRPSLGDQGDANRKEKKFVCEVLGCGKMFTYQTLLSAHKQRLHAASPATGGSNNKNRPYACSACRATFNTKANLSRHRSIHTREMPHACSDCGKRFRLLEFLKTHQKVHLRRKTAFEGRKKRASP